MSSGLYQVKLEVCFLESLNLWGFRLEITKRGPCMTFKTQKQRSCHHCQVALVVRCSERQTPRGLQIPARSLLSQLHSCLFLPAADKLSNPTAAPVHQTLSSALRKHEYTQRWQLSQILRQLPSVASRQLQPVLLHQGSGGRFSDSSLIPVPSLGPGFFSVSQVRAGSYSLLFDGFASLIDPWLVHVAIPSLQLCSQFYGFLQSNSQVLHRSQEMKMPTVKKAVLHSVLRSMRKACLSLTKQYNEKWEKLLNPFKEMNDISEDWEAGMTPVCISWVSL